MGERQAAGRAAEERAQALLRGHGLQPVQRNYRCRGGEIDLVMRDGTHLVFVEVRYRRNTAYGGALSSVDQRKRARLIHAANHYLAVNGWSGPCRFDVVGFDGHEEPRWVRDAFTA